LGPHGGFDFIIRLSRLGWAQERITAVVGSGDESGQGCQIINNTNFGEINNLLSQDRDMSYIAGHYQMCLKIGDGPQFPISQFFTKSKKVTDLFLGYDFRIDFLIT